jgi:hypothetical protein
MAFDDAERRLTSKFAGEILPSLTATVANSLSQHPTRPEIANFIMRMTISTATKTSKLSTRPCRLYMIMLHMSRVHALQDEVALFPRHPAFVLAQTCRMNQRKWSKELLCLLYDFFEPFDFVFHLPMKLILPFIDWEIARHAVSATSYLWICEMMLVKIQGEQERRRARTLARRLLRSRGVRSDKLKLVLGSCRAACQQAWEAVKAEEEQCVAGDDSYSPCPTAIETLCKYVTQYNWLQNKR